MPLKSKGKKREDVLNEREEKYCQLRMQGQTPLDAYSAAFRAKTANIETRRTAASRIENRPHVVRRLAALRDKVDDKVAAQVAKTIAITRTFVIDELVEIVRMGKQAIPVLDREGNETGEYKQNLNAAKGALELLGKEIGMFREGGRAEDPLDALTHEQAKALLDRLMEVAREPRPVEADGGRPAAPGQPAGPRTTH